MASRPNGRLIDDVRESPRLIHIGFEVLRMPFLEVFKGELRALDDVWISGGLASFELLWENFCHGLIQFTNLTEERTLTSSRRQASGRGGSPRSR